MLKKIMLLCALALPWAAQAADPGTLTKADTLRAKPFTDAALVSSLASGAKVDIITRSGAWYQVKSGTKTGWVRMLSVRRGAATSSSSVAGLANVASGRTGTGKVTTTTGVRGLDAQELDTAKFDEAQIKKAEGYRVSAKDAGAFAKAGKLSLRDVQPLPAPVKK
ncbi:MAG: SH3 domain-containing protein [Moraxellaceae bacterium]